MVGGRGLRGECPRRVPGRVPRDRARGDGLRPVLLPVARGALVLARRRSHCPDRRGAGVRVRTRVPRSDVARGFESCVPHRARMFRSRCGPSRPVPDRAASVEKADEARNAPGFRRDRLRGDPSQVCASNGARRVLRRTPDTDLGPHPSRDGRKRSGIRRGPPGPPCFLEGLDDRIRIPRGVPRMVGGGRGPGRPLGPFRVAIHNRGRGPAATCGPRHGVHRDLFDVSAHERGAWSSERLAVHLVVAPRSGARNRSDPRAIARQRSGSPPRVVRPSPRSSAGGNHHRSRARSPGLPHARRHRTRRRRRGDRGSRSTDSTRIRPDRPEFVRGPGRRGDGPRQVAVPDLVRGAPGPPRHRRRVLEGQGDGGALRGCRTHRGGRKMKRVSTHIEGLDEVLGGGIPEGNVVLVSGAPGTMKTSLTYHILHSSALTGSRGLYVSLEQGRASLIDHTEGLGYRLDDTHGNLSVLDLGTLRKKLTGSTEQPWLDLFKLYTQGIRKAFDYRFLVLDSLDALEILAKFGEPRRGEFSPIPLLRDLKCTAFLLGELPTDRTGGADPRRAAYAKHKEDYLVDGILHLRLARQGEFGMQRQLRVVKMRGTRHDTGYHALVFDNGFRVTRGFA